MDDELVGENLGEQFLAHYGKKGMRWGYRKGKHQPTTAGEGRMAVRAAIGTSSKRSATSAHREVKSLSDEELQRVIKRLEAEKKFKDLKKQDKSPGQQIAEEILRKAGTEIVSDLLKESGKAALKPYTVDRIKTTTTRKKS